MACRRTESRDLRSALARGLLGVTRATDGPNWLRRTWSASCVNGMSGRCPTRGQRIGKSPGRSGWQSGNSFLDFSSLLKIFDQIAGQPIRSCHLDHQSLILLRRLRRTGKTNAWAIPLKAGKMFFTRSPTSIDRSQSGIKFLILRTDFDCNFPAARGADQLISTSETLSSLATERTFRHTRISLNTSRQRSREWTGVFVSVCLPLGPIPGRVIGGGSR